MKGRRSSCGYFKSELQTQRNYDELTTVPTPRFNLSFKPSTSYSTACAREESAMGTRMIVVILGVRAR